jgi:hypothetical protein
VHLSNWWFEETTPDAEPAQGETTMDILTRQHVDSLAGHRSRWCASIYLPTDRTANGMLQNSIRLKNLVSQAQVMLADHGLRGPEAREAVEPLKELLADKKFRNGVADGLAIFLDPEGLQAYRLPSRFPGWFS